MYVKFPLKTKLVLVIILIVFFTVIIILPARSYVGVLWKAKRELLRMDKTSTIIQSDHAEELVQNQPNLKTLDTTTESASQKCFQVPSGPEWLDDILTGSKKPAEGKNIFFLETSCSESGDLQLTARQACAVESAAKANPGAEIYVLFAGARKFLPHLQVIDAILTYPNVNLRNVNLWTYTTGTPVEEWVKGGKLFNSKYLRWHVSDFLRLLTLWRWGGTYLDFDVVVKQSLSSLRPNFVGAQSDTEIANGVINMDHKGFGHFIALAFIEDFRSNYNGDVWGQNGPAVIQRVLNDLCNTSSTQLMSRDQCHGFLVLPPQALYAVPYGSWRDFFTPNKTKDVFEASKISILTHVWNYLSSTEVIKVGSKSAYALFAQSYCPRVYASCGEYF